jgi:hypothetical protein
VAARLRTIWFRAQLRRAVDRRDGLARDWQISRTPLREALKVLAPKAW